MMFSIFGFITLGIIYNNLNQFLQRNEISMLEIINNVNVECGTNISFEKYPKNPNFFLGDYSKYLDHYFNLSIYTIKAISEYSNCKNQCINISSISFEIRKRENSMISDVFIKMLKKIDIIRTSEKIKNLVLENLKNFKCISN
ncbi:MAG: hypothetical protein QXD62_02400 [Candidatus Woesearchaeota archaeon]